MGARDSETRVNSAFSLPAAKRCRSSLCCTTTTSFGQQRRQINHPPSLFATVVGRLGGEERSCGTGLGRAPLPSSPSVLRFFPRESPLVAWFSRITRNAECLLFAAHERGGSPAGRRLSPQSSPFVAGNATLPGRQVVS